MIASTFDSRQVQKFNETKLGLGNKISEMGLRLESRIDEAKSDIIKWMIGIIGFQTATMLSAIIALGHVARSV